MLQLGLPIAINSLLLLQLGEDHANQSEPAQVVELHMRQKMGKDWSASSQQVR